MTLILDLDLDVLEKYLRTKNKVCRLRRTKVRAQAGQKARQSTDATECITTSRSRVVIIQHRGLTF